MTFAQQLKQEGLLDFQLSFQLGRVIARLNYQLTQICLLAIFLFFGRA